MYNYSMTDWIAFFAVYCFIGWLFESIYVSIEYRKPVDRGFLYGPVLPIYGFGAIIILFVSLPFQKSLLLTFLSGMTGATVLEYLTGYAMEKMFGVRYWDYTYEPLNLNGYICLGCSLMWGMFSIVITEYLHKNVVRFINSFDDNVLIILDISFLVFLAVDTYASAKAAFDLKKMFKEYVETNENVIRMQKRLDVLLAFAEDDYNHFQSMVEEKKKEHEEEKDRIKSKLEEFRNKYYDNREKANKRVMYAMRRNPGMSSRNNRFELDSLKNIFMKK
ncbi:MAG: putative ABC transporter permease [Lachnospiraceae bacterium]|nr:putative ABC transporter permease [Lachnospiraceae bacterium]